MPFHKDATTPAKSGHADDTQATPLTDGRTLLEQTAFFAPKGLAGILYWYALYPIHRVIFSGLIDRVGGRAAAAVRATQEKQQ